MISPGIRRYGVPRSVHNGLTHIAREEGLTVSAATVLVLRRALPFVLEHQVDYVWPAPRSRYMERRDYTTLAFTLPSDLMLAYVPVATELLRKAVFEGRYDPGFDVFGKPAPNKYPLDWLLRHVLINHVPDADTRVGVPRYRVKSADPDSLLSGGPLVQVTLPRSALAWMDARRFNRSEFIRTAVRERLPALLQQPHLPPKSRLLHDVPQQNTPVRMSSGMHASLKDAAKARQVPMSHLIRASCLIHLAAMATQPKDPS